MRGGYDVEGVKHHMVHLAGILAQPLKHRRYRSAYSQLFWKAENPGEMPQKATDLTKPVSVATCDLGAAGFLVMSL